MTTEKPSLSSLPDFVRGYVTCALWLADENPPTGDYEASGNADGLFAKLAPETLVRMAADCAKFQADNAELLSRVEKRDSKIGHDLWLTRNHHGAGFWDGDYKDPFGNLLTKAAHKLGECNLYFGDDGLIYI